jgi:hypothetical protein
MWGFSLQNSFAQGKRGGPAADQPVQRTDVNSKLAHKQMVENLKKGRIDISFVGDSITRRWRATDYPQFLENLNKNFFGWNAANYGWGGDTIQNVLWRPQNGELKEVHPKVIVLLAGTNLSLAPTYWVQPDGRHSREGEAPAEPGGAAPGEKGVFGWA